MCCINVSLNFCISGASVITMRAFFIKIPIMNSFYMGPQCFLSGHDFPTFLTSKCFRIFVLCSHVMGKFCGSCNEFATFFTFVVSIFEIMSLHMIMVRTVVGKRFATFRADLFLVRFSFTSVFGLRPFTFIAVLLADGFTAKTPATQITAILA